ncbi:MULTISPECIES: hypothetical protein [unclassified Lebetimonas]|uniref:hypothetical protein n=1 Tax=unclassified Lebetimonas TaxID=2648158 RepID=UPI00046530DB|nr:MULTISPECIES: hypothetical protein [unclassified Lebetimonas]
MSLIGQITLINQNQHVPSIIASDIMAREVVSKELQKLASAEKERKVEEVRPVEEIEKIVPDEGEKEEVKKEATRHIDIKA